jgi:hypothetical protein
MKNVKRIASEIVSTVTYKGHGIASLETSILVNENDVNVEVEYEYTAGSKGSRDEQPYDDEINVMSVKNSDTKEEIELTKKETDALAEQCSEDYNNKYSKSAWEEGLADYLYDQQHDR